MQRKIQTWIIYINYIKNIVISQWGLLSSIEYNVFLRPGEQDQQLASQSSSRSFENPIFTEVENRWNDNTPTY